MDGHIGCLAGRLGHVCLQVLAWGGAGGPPPIRWAWLALTEPAGQSRAPHGMDWIEPAPQRTRLPVWQENHFWFDFLTIDLWEGRLLGHRMGVWHTLVGFFGGACRAVAGDVAGLGAWCGTAGAAGFRHPGWEDQGEPRAWELGHGHSREDGCAGKPPPQACPVSRCPLAGTLGRVHSGAHLLRLASLLALAAEDGALHLVDVVLEILH